MCFVRCYCQFQNWHTFHKHAKNQRTHAHARIKTRALKLLGWKLSIKGSKRLNDMWKPVRVRMFWQAIDSTEHTPHWLNTNQWNINEPTRLRMPFSERASHQAKRPRTSQNAYAEKEHYVYAHQMNETREREREGKKESTSDQWYDKSNNKNRHWTKSSSNHPILTVLFSTFTYLFFFLVSFCSFFLLLVMDLTHCQTHKYVFSK